MSADEQFMKEAVIVHLANILTKRANIGLCYEEDIAPPATWSNWSCNWYGYW